MHLVYVLVYVWMYGCTWYMCVYVWDVCVCTGCVFVWDVCVCAGYVCGYMYGMYVNLLSMFVGICT